MLQFIKGHIGRTQYIVMALLIAVPALGFMQPTYGLPLQQKRVILASSEPSAITEHSYDFTIPTNGNIGSIQFQYCDNSPFVDAPCTAPVGLDVSGTNIISQSTETGFSMHANTNANNIVITRPTSAVSAPANVTYTFDNIVNPSLQRYSVYVRIKTFPTSDASGPYTDEGSVVFSTDGQLNTGGYVPPYITFCVAVTVAPDCSTANGFRVDLGELSPGATSSGTSQFAVATNYPAGYIVFLSGNTLTSGNNTIPGLNTTSSSQTGVSQFGINLVANTNPPIGATVTGTGVSVPQVNYGIPNQYRFVSGSSIARSLKPTEFNRFTVSYIANVSEDQPAGVYNTTLQYTAVAQF